MKPSEAGKPMACCMAYRTVCCMVCSASSGAQPYQTCTIQHEVRHSVMQRGMTAEIDVIGILRPALEMLYSTLAQINIKAANGNLLQRASGTCIGETGETLRL